MGLPTVAAPNTVRINPTSVNIRPIGMRRSRFIANSSGKIALLLGSVSGK